MKKQKTLTIVISCYNSTATILSTLKSIHIQHYQDIDVFLIDDGSKDNLKDHVQAYLDLYPNQIHYFRKTNGNWGSCINFAIKKAKSKYLCVLDSDDTYNPKALRSVMSILRKVQKDTDMVFCNYVFHYLNKKKTKINPITVSHTYKRIKYLPIKKINLYHLITIHSAIISVDVLRRINPLPEHVSYADNLLIYESLLQGKKVAYINKNIFLYNYFIRPGEQSISIEKSIKNYSHFETVFKNMVNQPFDPKNRKHVRFANRFLNLILYWMAQILGNDYSRLNSEKSKLMNSYTSQIKKLEKKLHLKTRLEGPLFSILYTSPIAGINFIRSACNIFRVSFIRATEYDKVAKKWAKAMGKIRRKDQKLSKKKK